MCIIWDWNGTLLDDTNASLIALNTILSRRGLATISYEHYRNEFSFPVSHFYESLGVQLEKENWNALAEEYHDAYHEVPLNLASDAVEALTLARDLGFSQAVVSAMREDYLHKDMSKFGIMPFFDSVLGTDNLDGCSKLSRMKDFIAAAGKGEYVVIGDSLHDKEVADAVGAKCILYGGGGHAPSRLIKYAPVASTLLQAVRLINENLILP